MFLLPTAFLSRTVLLTVSLGVFSGCRTFRLPETNRPIADIVMSQDQGLFVFEETWGAKLLSSVKSGVGIDRSYAQVEEQFIRLNAMNVSEEIWLGTAKSGMFSQSWRPQYKLVPNLPAAGELEALNNLKEFEVALLSSPMKTTMLQQAGEECAQKIISLGSPPLPALSGWEGPPEHYHTTATWNLCSLVEPNSVEIMVIVALIKSQLNQEDWQGEWISIVYRNPLPELLTSYAPPAHKPLTSSLCTLTS